MELLLQGEPDAPLGHIVDVLLAVHRMCIAICAAGQIATPAAAVSSTHGLIHLGGETICIAASYTELNLLELDIFAAARRKCPPSHDEATLTCITTRCLGAASADDRRPLL